LDEAIKVARDYAGENTLLAVAGLGNPGGLRLNAFSFAPDRGIAVLGSGASGVPAVSWSAGAIQAEEGKETTLVTIGARTGSSEPVAEDVLVLASGPAASDLRGFLSLDRIHSWLSGSL
jgi:hypothetical protein